MRMYQFSIVFALATAFLFCVQPLPSQEQAESPPTETKSVEPTYHVVVTVTEMRGKEQVSAWSQSTTIDQQTAVSLVSGAELALAKAAQQNGEKNTLQGQAAIASLLRGYCESVVRQYETELAAVQAAQKAADAASQRLKAIQLRD